MATLSKKRDKKGKGRTFSKCPSLFLKIFTPYTFILPAVVLLIIILVFPLLFSFNLTFHEWCLKMPGKAIFIGLGNYRELLQDQRFIHSMELIVLFVAISVSIELWIGIGVALFLNRRFVGEKIIRSILLLPIFIVPVVSGLTFRFMYDPMGGVINRFLQIFGINGPSWLTDPFFALPSIVIQDIWRMWPFMFIILYAGLSSLPKEFYESAQVDGASRWVIFKNITLPLMKPTIFIALLLRSIDAFRAFDEVYVMTKGGPGNATELVSIYIYKQGFSFFRMGYAASLSYIASFVVLMLSIILIRTMYKAMVEYG